MSNGIITASSRDVAKAKAIREQPKRVGAEMPNGATILAQHERRDLGHAIEYVVLAVTGGFQPFVVWSRSVGVEEASAKGTWRALDFCFDGGYHRELADALADYNERAGIEAAA